MKIIVKDGLVWATHTDDQNVEDKYPGCEVAWVPDGTIRMPVDGSPPPADPRPALDQVIKDEMTERLSLKDELINLIATTSYSDMETKVENIFADHTPAQRTFLLNLCRVVLYLAKREV